MTLRSGGKEKYSVLRDIKVERRKQPKSIKLRIQWKKEFDHDIVIYCNPWKTLGRSAKLYIRKGVRTQGSLCLKTRWTTIRYPLEYLMTFRWQTHELHVIKYKGYTVDPSSSQRSGENTYQVHSRKLLYWPHCNFPVWSRPLINFCW